MISDQINYQKADAYFRVNTEELLETHEKEIKDLWFDFQKRGLSESGPFFHELINLFKIQTSELTDIKSTSLLESIEADTFVDESLKRIISSNISNFIRQQFNLKSSKLSGYIIRSGYENSPIMDDLMYRLKSKESQLISFYNDKLYIAVDSHNNAITIQPTLSDDDNSDEESYDYITEKNKHLMRIFLLKLETFGQFSLTVNQRPIKI